MSIVDAGSACLNHTLNEQMSLIVCDNKILIQLPIFLKD